MLSRLSLIIIAQIADTLPFLQLRHTPPGYATQRWLLGYDPLYLACEGRVVAVVAPDQAQAALAAWRALPLGKQAAIIGRVTGTAPRVILETPIGGKRVLEELQDDPLPRIC